MFGFNSCCRPCCPQPCCPQPCPTPCRPIINNITSILAGEFATPVSTPVASGSTIPLTTTVFNNAASYVTNNNGVISLTGPGLYYVSYNVQANNTTANSSTATIGFAVNGNLQTYASSQSTIPAGTTETLTNSTLISVPTGTSTANLIITSTETLSLLSNVVVIKLS